MFNAKLEKMRDAVTAFWDYKRKYIVPDYAKSLQEKAPFDNTVKIAKAYIDKAMEEELRKIDDAERRPDFDTVYISRVSVEEMAGAVPLLVMETSSLYIRSYKNVVFVSTCIKKLLYSAWVEGFRPEWADTQPDAIRGDPQVVPVTKEKIQIKDLEELLEKCGFVPDEDSSTENQRKYYKKDRPEEWA